MAFQDAFDPHTFLAHIGSGRTLATYRPHSPIFAQGDVADAVFYIQRGQVKLTVVSVQGKGAMIAILEAQGFFGEGCLTGEPQRIATATALTDCALMRIEKSVMIHVLHAEPAFAALFTAYLLTCNRRIEADLIDQLFNLSEKRLARVLLLLAHFGKDGQTELVIPRISQEMLAEMVGTTRSRVSFFLNKFRRLGFIDYNGGLHVHSSFPPHRGPERLNAARSAPSCMIPGRPVRPRIH
jgi:CRP/FNR family transcriptional regulator, cyclic AMP receptor protein